MAPRVRNLALCLLLLAVAVVAREWMRWTPAEYVRIDDGSFVLGGRPYRFVGVNYWYAAVLGRADSQGDRARLCRELDRLESLGLTNLRVLALAERSEATTLSVVAQEAPGQFSEAWFDGLDFALNEMEKRGFKTVLCLNNYWNWSGGMAQYQAWSGGGAVVPDSGGWPERNRYVCRFYGNDRAQRLFEAAVEHLVSRRNRYSGRQYRDDPVIMSWQICNEARPGTHQQTAALRDPMLAWFRRSASHLRGMGVRQLVSSGCEGVFGCNGDEALYRALHELPEIDYLTAHLWPQNWRWYDPKRAEETLPVTLQRSAEFLQQHIAIADALGKPLVLEEFGLARDGGEFHGRASTSNRDRFLALVGAAWKDGLGTRSPLQGFNIWSWGGEAVPFDNSGSFWRPGLPLTGDNPNEPQGWYSIGEGDAATVRLLGSFASEPAALAPSRLDTPRG